MNPQSPSPAASTLYDFTVRTIEVLGQPIAIERLVPGGEGLGRDRTGRVVLAGRVAPGDVIVPNRAERRGGAVRVLGYDLRQPGPERAVPSCPWVDQCGGCDWMHLGPNAQRSGRLALIADALRRTGGGAGLEAPLRMVSPGPDWNYRQRLRLHVTTGGQVGLKAPGSGVTVSIAECRVARPGLNAAIALLNQLGREERRILAEFESIELRAAPAAPDLVLRMTPRRAGARETRSLGVALAKLGPLVVAGSREDVEFEQHYVLPGPVTLSAAAGAFTQVHPEVNARLVEAVVAGAKDRALCTFIEPYAGAGNFTLPLLAAGLTGRACDLSPSGILSARRSARRQGLPYDAFDVGDALHWLEARVRAHDAADLVLLDPPRRGAGSRVLAAASRLAPCLALIACDPVSLARDLALLRAGGFEAQSLTAFDMFPQTHHVETLAWLERRCG